MKRSESGLFRSPKAVRARVATSSLEPSIPMLRGFIVLRVIVVTTLLLSAFLIQVTFDFTLPLKPIYYLAAFAYTGSIAAAITLRRIRPEAHAGLQIVFDLAVITGIVYVSRGPDSGFTFLYLSSIAAGTILLGKRGGLITGGLAAVFYAVLVDLMHFNVLPVLETSDVAARLWSPPGLVGNVTMNIVAFIATALLVAASSEKLREARADLERRDAEMARLQALHSSVLASMSSGVLTCDVHGLVTYVNPPGLEILGRNSTEVLGRPLVEIGLVEKSAWEQIRGASEMLRFEGIRAPFGREAYYGVSATVLRDEQGSETGRILIFQNLTELKKLESEVRLKEKMAAVGELAAGIAHEIRNPLASISGSVQALRGSAAPGSSERRLMEIVVHESTRLSRILDDFLKYVRPREQALEHVDAPGALRDVLTLVAHGEEFTDKHRLETDLVPDSVILPADPGQLRQIFWNLTRNALAAMPTGGTLAVSSRVSGGFWTVSLRDEGRGMTPEERDRLFTPFAHNFPGGTGLGLAIVYRIVEEHRGTIRVETAIDRGTTITISLPVRSDALRQVA